MARFELSQKTWLAAVQNRKTRAALAAEARQIQVRAESIAGSEKVKLNSEVVEVTRPKGRTEARVQSPNVQQEWGSANVDRRRILGRAAGSA